MLEAGGTGGASGTAAATADETLDETPDGLGEAGQRALARERDARKAAQDKLKAIEDELATLRSEKTQREQAESEAQQRDAEARGEFERLANERKAELEKAKTEVTRLTSEVDQLRAAIDALVESGWTKLPKRVQELFSGDPNDPLARLNWLPKAQELAADLDGKKPIERGSGRDPLPAGTGVGKDDDRARAANASRYR